MGIAILSGVFTSLQSRPISPQTPNEPVSGFSTPTQSFSLSAPEASLPSGFIATVGREETVRKLSKTLNAMEYVSSGRAGGNGVQVLAGPESNLQAVTQSDVILLCCKPQMVAGILTQEGMSQALEGKMVISICAGVRMEQLKELCPESTVCLRAMPNTPSKVGLSPRPICYPSSPADFAFRVCIDRLAKE
jgi:pyrroline-5-carboxylate reductase